MGRRASVAREIRAHVSAASSGPSHPDAVTLRLSSSAAEAAKCLADGTVVAIVLLDRPRDADAVRASASTGAPRVFTLDADDAPEALMAELHARLVADPGT